MRTIPLTKGYEAIVDDKDYEWLSQWKWHALVCPTKVYAMRNSKPVNGKRHHIMMHRIINETPDGFDTDHDNGNGIDNRRKNLRTASRSQNMWNRNKNRKGSSKFKGVFWHKQHQKWYARIQFKKRNMFIGLFDDEDDAGEARRKKAEELFGEFGGLS